MLFGKDILFEFPFDLFPGKSLLEIQECIYSLVYLIWKGKGTHEYIFEPLFFKYENEFIFPSSYDDIAIMHSEEWLENSYQILLRVTTPEGPVSTIRIESKDGVYDSSEYEFESQIRFHIEEGYKLGWPE